ncbi:cyclin-like protein [Phascolomyces articulosus]|uniref:Cyclin-like protein n=1 Tax=Phascolomyces articulosus TaxID=60185 RepID=A0AAD5K304_9FUNG|nr:cyclin-like protein [Phascolomyces articulosus]
MEDQWIFTTQELQQVPSIASGAMSAAEERKLRIYGCTFIQAIGCRLELPQLAISTAMVYFHRFFARESFNSHKYEQIAATCVYLACKVEESSRKAIDVAKACSQYRLSRSNHSEDNAKHHVWCEAIIWNEHLLLEVLCFDFTVEHPYQALFHYAEEARTQENVLQAAWAFANDSLRLTLCLHYEPHLIAAACLVLGYQLINKNKEPKDPKVELPEDGEIGKVMDANFDALQDIIRSIMNSYSIIKAVGTSPPHHRGNSSRQVGTSRRTIHSTITQASPNTLILDVVQ